MNLLRLIKKTNAPAPSCTSHVLKPIPRRFATTILPIIAFHALIPAKSPSPTLPIPGLRKLIFMVRDGIIAASHKQAGFLLLLLASPWLATLNRLKVPSCSVRAPISSSSPGPIPSCKSASKTWISSTTLNIGPGSTLRPRRSRGNLLMAKTPPYHLPPHRRPRPRRNHTTPQTLRRPHRKIRRLTHASALCGCAATSPAANGSKATTPIPIELPQRRPLLPLRPLRPKPNAIPTPPLFPRQTSFKDQLRSTLRSRIRALARCRYEHTILISCSKGKNRARRSKSRSLHQKLLRN